MTNEKIIKYCKREMRKIEREYGGLFEGSYTNIEAMNGEEAYAFGRHTGYADIVAMLEKQETDTYRNNVRQGRVDL